MTSPPAGWAERLVGPLPTLKEIHLVCWGIFFAFLILPLCLMVGGRIRSGQSLHVLDADFVYFYSMGRMLNEHPPEQLYNYELQKRVCTEVHALRNGVYGPIPYPPFVGILFRPFARLPYAAAYLLWLSISLSLYIAGVVIFSARFFPHDPLWRSLMFCFALSFYPFIGEAMISGHLSTIGFFALALAFRAQDAGRPLLTGLALSLCLYKPTLLLLFLPMQLVARNFKALAGFAAGASALALFATAVEGFRVWAGYAQMLFSFALGSVAAHSRSFKQLWKYVDLSSLSSSVPGGRSWLGVAVLLVCVCCVALSLFRLWWRAPEAGNRARTLTWAATLTWTLLLNLYVPIYDSILAVLSVAATAAVLKDMRNGSLRLIFSLVCVLIYVCSWFTQDLAAATGFQVLTASLAALGVLQFVAFRRLAATPGKLPSSHR